MPGYEDRVTDGSPQAASHSGVHLDLANAEVDRYIVILDEWITRERARKSGDNS